MISKNFLRIENSISITQIITISISNWIPRETNLLQDNRERALESSQG